MNRSHLLKARRLQSNVLILLRDLLYNIFEKVNDRAQKMGMFDKIVFINLMFLRSIHKILLQKKLIIFFVAKVLGDFQS